MEFWGVEVKPGETVKCDPGEDKYLHLSQASLGETKKEKGSENVPVFVKFNDRKLVLGTLSMEKCAQISYDLVFEKEFELSHSSKNASVYFCGYKTIVMDELDDFAGSDSEEDDIKLSAKDDGKPRGKVEVAKATAAKKIVANAGVMATKPKIKIDEPENADKKDNEDDEEDDIEDDDEEDEEVESDDDEDMVEAEDDSDEDEDGSSDEEDEEATPEKVKAGPGNKRPVGSASKTPTPEKKAKLVSPVGSQKTGGDGKKGVHIATPYPAKQVGKTPANCNKAKQQQTPKFGTVSCKSCSKTFNSENALQAHSKAKHSTGLSTVKMPSKLIQKQSIALVSELFGDQL